MISLVLNYILLVYVLNVLKKTDKDLGEYKRAYNKSLLTMLLVLVPTVIIGVALCFASWLPAFSFGMVIFWGAILALFYNALVTRALALNSINDKVNKDKTK